VKINTEKASKAWKARAVAACQLRHRLGHEGGDVDEDERDDPRIDDAAHAVIALADLDDFLNATAPGQARDVGRQAAAVARALEPGFIEQARLPRLPLGYDATPGKRWQIGEQRLWVAKPGCPKKTTRQRRRRAICRKKE